MGPREHEPVEASSGHAFKISCSRVPWARNFIPWARNFKILGTEFQKVGHGIFKIWARLFYRIETPHLEFLPVLFLNRSTILPLVFLNGRKYGIFVLFLFCIVSSQKIIKYIWVDVQICWGGRFTKQYGCHTQSDMASIQNNMATKQHNMATIQNVKSSLFCGTLCKRRWSRKLLFQQ
jgi:hypothetical protein